MPNQDPDPTEQAQPALAGPAEDTAAGEGDKLPSEAECFQVSRASLVYRYLLLLALSLIGVLLLSILIPMAVSGQDYLIGALLALWALALLRYWVFLLAMPHRICLEGDACLVLHSLFQTKKIDCNQIVAMRVSPFYQSYLRIVTSKKKTFPMLNHIDGLHDLINWIKRVNPDLQTKGC